MKDHSGFPLTLKPGHLFGSTEMMSAAEVLSAIVEQACLYEPESSVGETFKSPKGPTRAVPKEQPTRAESPKEERTSVEKKVLVSSDLVRIK